MSHTLARLLALLWALLILIACSIPGRDIPSVNIVEFDKFVHFTLFAVLGWLLLHAFQAGLTERILWTLGMGIAYAIGTEFYQGLLPFERSPDALDALANTFGLLVAVLVFYVWYRRAEQYE
jgi:VanZ family protein